MANSDAIVRLKLDSGEYENKIKRATQGLLTMEKECRAAGGTLAYMDKEQKAFVQSLGKMETKSQTAKGKVAELTGAFTELRSQYNRLTNEEKNGDYGKALNSSLEQLKGRINDAKGELNKINGEINNNGSLLDQLSGKFGVNIKQLGTWGAALGAGKVALDVMKDSMMSNESMVDEWGRTVEVSSSLYESFVSSLNNASLDSFFSNIQGVINKAREAYDALDNLKTKGGIISNKEAKINYQMQKEMAIINDKSNSIAERQASQQRLSSLKRQMRNAKLSTSNLNSNYVKQSIGKILEENGFREGTSGYKEAYRRIERSLYDENYKMGSVDTGFRGGMKINNGKTVRYTDNGMRNLDNIVTDEWRNGINPYVQAMWNSLGAGENVSRMANRFAQKAITSSRSGGGSGRGNGTAEAPLELNFTPKFMTQDEESKYLANILSRQETPNINLGLQLAEGAELKDVIGSMGFEGLGNDFKVMNEADVKRAEERTRRMKEEAEAMRKSWQDAAGAIGSVGQALSMIQDPAAKVLGIIAEAVASVALTFAQSLKGTFSPWDWIAGAAAGTATMISTIAAIKSATAEYHAEGGFVGSPRGTDVTPMWATPGELVLNRAQQQNLADQLQQGGGGGGYQGQPYVSGEKIFLGINAYLRRSGRGELITSR